MPDSNHVLFITKNKEYFAGSNGGEKYYFEGLMQAASVLHIVVVTNRIEGYKVKKLNDRVWIYPTNSTWTFLHLFDIWRVVRFQLFVAEMLHVHVVHSDDPGVVGWAGLLISQWYQRVWVVNVPMYVWRMTFRLRHPLRAATYVPLFFLLIFAHKISTFSDVARIYLLAKATKSQRKKIVAFPQLKETELIGNTQAEIDIREQYPEFNFILLLVEPLGALTHAGLAIQTLEHLRRRVGYSKAGLVVVGSGPYKWLLYIKVFRLGLFPWVRFEDEQPSIASYMKTANIFLYLTDTTDENRAMLTRAVAAHCPVISVDGTFPRGLITNKANGFIIEHPRFDELTEKIIELNEIPGLRESFKANSDINLGPQIEENRIHAASILQELWNYEEAPEPFPQMPIIRLHPLVEPHTPTKLEVAKKILAEMFPLEKLKKKDPNRISLGSPFINLPGNQGNQ